MSETNLINRVAQSALITLKPEDFLPEMEIVEFDLKDFLFRELILKEMDFRTAMKELDWDKYRNKILAVYCSNDAIIPTWAYMLVTVHARAFVNKIYFGNREQVLTQAVKENINTLEASGYQDKKVVIKGCSDRYVPPSAYLDLTEKLMPYASSIMYGEPCSTVPVYKRK